MLQRRIVIWILATAALVSPLAAEARAEDKPQKSIAHIRLSGDLEEGAGPAETLLGASEETFKTKLDRLRKARKDSSVAAVLLELDEPTLGLARIDELSQAIAEVRKSGKKVYAYTDSANTGGYLLALAADEIIMPESGVLMLTGMRMEITFYKELFEKLGIQADMLQMGEFKGAAEPYTRSNLSEPSRKQLTSVLDDRYDHDLVERMVKARPAKKWTPEEVKQRIDQGPYTAKAALRVGLVDKLAYFDDVDKLISKAAGEEPLKMVRNYGHAKAEDVDLSNPFALLKLLNPPKTKTNTKPKIAVIYAVGVINTGKSGRGLMGGEEIGSTTMVEAIREAEKDSSVKAIVLRINSPGGSALASDLIWNELKRCKKPVLASMGDVAASGGYYIAMGTKKIYADPGTLTGSIGVVGGKLAVSGLYEKFGITTETLSRGTNANIFSSKPFTKSEKENMTLLMRDIYDQFLEKALEGRKTAGKTMTRSDLEKLAGGRVWTGRQARANGLVDELGTLEDVIAEAAKLGKLPADKEPELLLLPHSRSFLDSLIERKAETKILERMMPLARQAPEVRSALSRVEQMLRLRGEATWLILPYGIQER
jgi:protease-4